MNAVRTLAQVVHPDRNWREMGVLGLVDELLAYCCDHGCRLSWQGGQIATDNGESVAVAFPPSVHRAVIARVAALCNRHRSRSVSPYGGQGEFVVEAPTITRFRADFANTPDEQRLELVPTMIEQPSAATSSEGRLLAAQDELNA